MALVLAVGLLLLIASDFYLVVVKKLLRGRELETTPRRRVKRTVSMVLFGGIALFGVGVILQARRLSGTPTAWGAAINSRIVLEVDNVFERLDQISRHHRERSHVDRPQEAPQLNRGLDVVSVSEIAKISADQEIVSRVELVVNIGSDEAEPQLCLEFGRILNYMSALDSIKVSVVDGDQLLPTRFQAVMIEPWSVISIRVPMDTGLSRFLMPPE